MISFGLPPPSNAGIGQVMDSYPSPTPEEKSGHAECENDEDDPLLELRTCEWREEIDEAGRLQEREREQERTENGDDGDRRQFPHHPGGFFDFLLAIGRRLVDRLLVWRAPNRLLERFRVLLVDIVPRPG